MLDQHGQQGVEQRGLLRIGLAAGDLEEGEVAQVEVADDLVVQVVPAHDDGAGVAPAHV
ncbi:Uncharacterised protein [Bordetella pertussis]|nr:Uncharacterised protein [Bordetella pertussis]